MADKTYEEMTDEERNELLYSAVDTILEIYTDNMKSMLNEIRSEILRRKILNLKGAQVESFNNGIDEAANAIQYYISRIDDYKLLIGNTGAKREGS